MPKSEIPTNAYTYAPEQHPNLILGSLQLLFWLIFRPRAWENHLKQINPSFDKNVYLWQLLKNQRWRQREVRRFLIQGFILLPILLSLVIGIISWGVGTPFDFVAFSVMFVVAFSMAIGMVAGVAMGAIGVVIGVAFSVGIGVTVSVTGEVVYGVVYGVITGVATG
ncbi:MAG: ATP-binding protein, partial [Leptolyngbya sp. SIO3F4]|nr:ATP-binding protein [Leptolyngbya sp. SIO3F4]